MTKEERFATRDVDALLKAMLILSRTVDRVLETRASDAAEVPLSRSHLQILRLLHRRKTQTSSDIARYLGVTKPGVSQIVAAMVRRGLLHRHTSHEDRRQQELSLSPKGRAVLERVRGKQRHFVRSAVRENEKARTRGWIETLNEMTRALVISDRNFQRFCLQCGAHANDTCVLEDGQARCLYLEARARRPVAR